MSTYYMPGTVPAARGYRNGQDYLLALSAPPNYAYSWKVGCTCTTLARHQEHFSHVLTGLDLARRFLPFKEEQVREKKAIY